MVQLLLKKGFDLEPRVKQGRTALSYAAFNGHEVLTKVLLRHGAGIEAVGDSLGSPILHMAAGADNKAMVLLLLAEGANVEGSDNDGRTALQIAVYQDKESMVRTLLAKRADVNTKNFADQRPIHRAVFVGNKAIVALLLGKGALLEVEDGGGQTPLMLALIFGKREILELLSVKLRARRSRTLKRKVTKH